MWKLFFYFSEGLMSSGHSTSIAYSLQHLYFYWSHFVVLKGGNLNRELALEGCAAFAWP